MDEDDLMTGHLAEFHLADENGDLVEVLGLTEIPLPSGGKALYETSDLKTRGNKKWRKEPLADGDSPELKGNYFPRSATDLLLANAKADNGPRAFKIKIPMDDEETQHATFTGEVLVMDYKRDAQTTGNKRTFALSIKWSGEITEGEEAA